MRRLALATSLLSLVALVAIFGFAPRESSMGDVQRIVYLHVSVAWCGLVSSIALGLCGAAYLCNRNLNWDDSGLAAAEIGWLTTTLTLATGSLWAREAWGVWWTWEPRLMSAFILWLIFSGYFVLRGAFDEQAERRARACAVIGILGVADVPLVILATRWFRGMHPVSPEMDPRMRIVLLVSVVAFSTLFLLLAVARRRQLTELRHAQS